MIFPMGYAFALNDYRRQFNFPNLNTNNFTFESLRDEDYNCVAWIHEIQDEWIQFKDVHGSYDISINRYIEYFKEFGYKISENKNLEKGVVKIAIYCDSRANEFKHVARQLPNGKWASKLGDWEDIIHENPDVLFGKLYGNDLIIMQKEEL